ncbi:MAG: glycerol-3-phosphate 1-O-acyltransferase PlsY [Candidatus Heimdallarchaeota archaeon]
MTWIEWVAYVSLVIGSYLIGSLQTGWFLGKIIKNIDIRDYGSGNTGFSNVYRILGKGPAIITLIGDIFVKGFVVVWAVRLIVTYLVIDQPPTNALEIYTMGLTTPLSQGMIVLSGLMAIAGHNWPIWFGFKGGKGMATTAGVFFAIAPATCAGLTIIWLIIVKTTSYTSLANIIATPTSSILFFFEAYFIMGLKVVWYLLPIGGLVAGLFVLYSHRENIKRLRNGEERKFGDKTERIEQKEEVV